MSQPTIRTAVAADVAAIGALLEGLADALGDPQPYAPDLHALERHGFGEHPIYRALIAEQHGTPRGLCVYFPEFSTWRCKPGLYVQDLFVESGLRGQGLGSALLAEATRRAHADWDAAYLRLAVHVLNRDALEFYKALGFTADPDNRVMLLTDNEFDDLMSG